MGHLQFPQHVYYLFSIVGELYYQEIKRKLWNIFLSESKTVDNETYKKNISLLVAVVTACPERAAL